MKRLRKLRQNTGTCKAGIFQSRNMVYITLVILLVITVLVVPPVSRSGTLHAETMAWSVVNTPDSTNNVIVSPSEINALAAGPDGITFFAADIPHSKLYRSIDSGTGWQDISNNLVSAGATLPVWNIVTAPDNSNFVAAVTSIAGIPRQIFISTDGGDSWQNTSCPATNAISALDISANYGKYDIVAGTRTGVGSGKVYIFQGFAGWADQGFTGDVLAIKCSPDYGNDSSYAVVYADATGTYVALGVRDIPANSTNWSLWGPVEVTISGAGSSPKANQVITADLELPFDFSGQIAERRRFYVSTNDANITGNAGIYRIDDTLAYRIMSVTGTKMISSIAYYGSYNSGKLLAGEVKADPSQATVDIWFSPDPWEVCPQSACIQWQKAVKPPTGGADSGNANAQVLWGADGSRAYCGTSSANLDVAGWPNGYMTAAARDESAFSLSLDNGSIWNQLSLIDTVLSFLSDVAASPGSDVLYLASVNTNAGNTGFDSLWRSSSFPHGQIWERVYCLLSPADDIIVRINSSTAPQSVVLACRQSGDLFHSLDTGQRWNKVLPGVTITDCAYSETDGVLNIYILDGNNVRRGDYKNGIWKWGQTINTGLSTGHSITAEPGGLVVAGDASQGMVAYSIDGGNQFAKLPALPQTGNVHVIADTRILNYIILYAASDNPAGKVYGWVINETSAWMPMGAPDQQFYGLAQDNTLYCAWSDGTNSGANRTLMPEALGPPAIEWGNMTSGLTAGVIFSREPVSLKVSGGPILWAIDNRTYSASTGRLWTYMDCLSPTSQPIVAPSEVAYLYQAPTPILPEDGSLIPEDDKTEKPSDIEFKWKHPTLAVGYELVIAEDESFDNIVLHQKITPEIPPSPEWTLTSKNSPLETGKTYYWVIRVYRDANYGRGEGEWSTTMSFRTEGQQPEVPQATVEELELLYPADNAYGVSRYPSFRWSSIENVAEYEFILATDEQLNNIIIRASVPEATYVHGGQLEPGETYYWQVTTEDAISPVFHFTVSDNIAPANNTQGIRIQMVFWIAGVIVLCIIIVVLIIVFRHRKTQRTG